MPARLGTRPFQEGGDVHEGDASRSGPGGEGRLTPQPEGTDARDARGWEAQPRARRAARPPTRDRGLPIEEALGARSSRDNKIKGGRRPTRSGWPPGRPRRVTPELVTKVLASRARGLPWNVEAQHAGLPAGACRKVRSAPPTVTGSAEKGLAEFRNIPEDLF